MITVWFTCFICYRNDINATRTGYKVRASWGHFCRPWRQQFPGHSPRNGENLAPTSVVGWVGTKHGILYNYNYIYMEYMEYMDYMDYMEYMDYMDYMEYMDYMDYMDYMVYIFIWYIRSSAGRYRTWHGYVDGDSSNWDGQKSWIDSWLLTGHVWFLAMVISGLIHERERYIYIYNNIQ